MGGFHCARRDLRFRPVSTPFHQSKRALSRLRSTGVFSRRRCVQARGRGGRGAAAGAWGILRALLCARGLHLLGDTGVEFTDLLEQKYIGSRAGSSAQEVVRCAEDHGLHAYAASPVSIASIRAAQGPVVLHVKADAATDTYSHWVLYLGESAGTAQVYSGPSTVTAMSFAGLSTMWDGTAIFLSDSEPSRLRIWSPSIAQFLMWVAITAVVIAALQTTVGRRHLPLLVELPLFLSLPIILATAYHVFGNSGFARCPTIVEAVERFHVADLAPRLSLSDLEALQRDGERSVVVVDARLPSDFATAHLPGAINIPPTASVSQVSAALATVSRAATICVYCQSANCEFDATVARRLQDAGWNDVRLFREGWSEWSAQHTAHVVAEGSPR